jgi:hypothetical protein
MGKAGPAHGRDGEARDFREAPSKRAIDVPRRKELAARANGA